MDHSRTINYIILIFMHMYIRSLIKALATKQRDVSIQSYRV